MSAFPECPASGWYWLIRKRDQAFRMAHFDRVGSGWRLSDAIGRTNLAGAGRLERLYDYHSHVRVPPTVGDAS